MDNYTASPHLKKDPKNPEPQHIGEAAGGEGTMGRSNNGEDHRQPINYRGTFGPDMGTMPSSEARRLIRKSTGVNVNDGANPSLYGKKGTY